MCILCQVVGSWGPTQAARIPKAVSIGQNQAIDGNRAWGKAVETGDKELCGAQWAAALTSPPGIIGALVFKSLHLVLLSVSISELSRG